MAVVAAPGSAARSAALNEQYHLGTFAPKAPAPAPKKAAPLSLAAQAQQLANQSVAAQVAAIRQQQTLALQQAQDRADQINSASRAAAAYMSGLGTPVYDTYKDAATTLAGLAGGFGGQLQGTATTEANKVAADLAAAGSPASAQNTAPQLANVLYGLRGTQPAASLLAAGTAAGARESAIPQGLLGYGQDLATGALGAGRSAADQFTPQILDAQSKGPSIAAQYLQQFQGQANNERDYQLKVQALNALNANRTNTTLLSQQRLKVQQNQFVASQRRLIDQFNATQATNAAKLALPNGPLSGAKGYLVDARGQTIPDANGNKQILPGFKPGPNGRVVKVASTAKAPKTGDAATWPNLTKAQVIQLRSGVAHAFNGWNNPTWKDPATGKIPVDKKTGKTGKFFPPVDYWTAVQEAVTHGFSKAGAIKMANRFYMPGVRGRPKGP